MRGSFIGEDGIGGIGLGLLSPSTTPSGPPSASASPRTESNKSHTSTTRTSLINLTPSFIRGTSQTNNNINNSNANNTNTTATPQQEDDQFTTNYTRI